MSIKFFVAKTCCGVLVVPIALIPLSELDYSRG